ncbi:unnamed protein product [marine sediment metagenome]|uniref:Uncharacterized protein n=1 Tax=marine sediment metagenome TaxID=412755 RepID=X1QJQ4_9ZZZZ
MNNNTGIVFLALFGLIAVAGVAIVVASRGIGKQAIQASQSIYGVPLEPQTPLAAPVLYENEERWELRRGPDRLIEEVIIHRTVTQNA